MSDNLFLDISVCLSVHASDCLAESRLAQGPSYRHHAAANLSLLLSLETSDALNDIGCNL